MHILSVHVTGDGGCTLSEAQQATYQYSDTPKFEDKRNVLI